MGFEKIEGEILTARGDRVRLGGPDGSGAGTGPGRKGDVLEKLFKLILLKINLPPRPPGAAMLRVG